MPKLTEAITEELVDEKYLATTYTVLRGAWFFDFTSHIFRKYVDTDQTLDEIAKDAYNAHLAHRHNWFIKTAVNWAINLINKREEFEQSIMEEECQIYLREY